MNAKRLLAILLAVCLVVPMAACKKGEGSSTGGGTTTTTVADVTDGNGEVVGTTTGEGETTPTETNEQGEVVVPTDDKGQTVPTKSNNTPGGTTTRPGRTTTAGKVTTAPRPPVEGYVGQDITIKKGDKRADVGVDFGGKTFLYAFNQTDEQFFKTEWANVEKKHNCKIKLYFLSVGNRTEQIASATAAGTAFDMMIMSLDYYPSMITANLLQPLDDYVTTADLWDTKHPEKGGLSKSIMKQLSWNNSIYTVSGPLLTSPYMVYYNKKMFNDFGLEDPLTLYKQGKWTWEKFLEMGREVTDTSKNFYFTNSVASFNASPFYCTYDTDIAVLKNGVMKENLSDKKLYNALKMLQDMHYGTGTIVNSQKGDMGKMGYEAFARGTTATFLGTAGQWLLTTQHVEGKAAFDGKVSNIGMVPAPVQNTAKKHGLWGMMGYCAGIGSTDPRFTVCFALYDSTYNTREIYIDSVPAEYKKLLTDLVATDNFRAPVGSFKTSIGGLPQLEIANKACAGDDIAKVLSTYKRQVQRVLDAATK